jgi:hypothetical protein
MLRVCATIVATVALGVAGALAAPTSSILDLPLQIGAGAGPSSTVRQIVQCLEHGPIPLHARAVSDFGDGRYTLVMYNALEQYALTLAKSARGVRLTSIDRDNGPRLATPADLRRFVRRACSEATR